MTSKSGETPLEVFATTRFERRYQASPATLQSSCQRAVVALAGRAPTPGLRIKPIQPDKYFHEARLNRGDRLFFRVESSRLYLVDLVSHDDIERYGRR